MSNVNLVLDTAQNDIFLAPVELERIARCEVQRNERVARAGSRRLLELADKALNR